MPSPDRTLIVVPAHNEIDTVAALVRRTRKLLGHDVLVVSDCSSDGTAASARVAGALVLELPVQLGAWGATQTGLRFAAREGYTRVVTMDADGQHDPASVRQLLEASSPDNVVIGMCPERLSVPKRIAWSWFRALTGLSMEDLTSGLRVYGSSAIRLLASPQATLLDYQDVGVLMLLRQHRLAIIEMPVAMRPREAGHSRVFGSWLLVARYMLQTTVLCVARIGQRPRPLQSAREATT